MPKYEDEREDIGGGDYEAGRALLIEAFNAGYGVKGKFRDPNRAFEEYNATVTVDYGTPSKKALRKAFFLGLIGRETFDPDSEIKDWWSEDSLPSATEGLSPKEYREGRKSGKIK